MKQQFLINESEKERILSLHKTATERQYLSEQNSSYKTGPITYLPQNNQPKKVTNKPVQTPCPVGKGTKEEVMVFQDWLDINVKGWVPKYPDGLKKDVKKGYGMCGPNTRREWAKQGENFKLQQSVKFKPSDVVANSEEDIKVPEPNKPLTPEQTAYDSGTQGYGLDAFKSNV